MTQSQAQSETLANQTLNTPISNLDKLLDTLSYNQQQPMIAAVIHPTSADILSSTIEAAERGWIEPILVGNSSKIQAAADAANLNISGYQLLDAPHSHAAIEIAADLAHHGQAHMLIKGSVHTDEMMSVILDAKHKLRTQYRMSHVWLMQVPHYHKLLMISDAALNVTPDMMTKRDIIQNAVNVAHDLGIAQPKVAILAAQEYVKPQLPSTVDAACLCKMSDRGQITGAILDGPLALDNAINLEAANIKGISSKVAGDADILIPPDLESGNMLGKQLLYLAEATAAGLVVGAKVPIVLTSRSEHAAGRLYSIALGALVAHKRQHHLQPAEAS